MAMDNPDQNPMAWEVNFLIYFFLELYSVIFNKIYYFTKWSYCQTDRKIS